MPKTPPRKRPCRICRRWFLPDPRVQDRQKTCGRPSCQNAWHRKKCALWNRENSDYFKANYLQKKLEVGSTSKGSGGGRSTSATFCSKSGLPYPFIQEVIDFNHLVILEYQSEVILRRCRRLIESHLTFGPYSIRQQTGKTFSRGDPSLTAHNK